MQSPHGIGAVEIGQGAGDAQGAMPGAGREAEALGGAREQRAAVGVGFGDGGQKGAIGVGIAAWL